MPRQPIAPAAPTPDLSHITPGLRPLAVPISTLVHDPHNAREHGAENSAAIEGSLRRFGQRQVVIYNTTLGNRVIAGNERLRVARDVLGWTHIAALPVVEDEQSSVGYALADNRTAELAGWNRAALEQALALSDPGMGEQLDRMVIELGRAMNVAMPDMTAQERRTRPQGGRGRDDVPEPSSGQDNAALGQQRAVAIGGMQLPLTPSEEQGLERLAAEYRQTHQTLFGFWASLMEQAAETAERRCGTESTPEATPQ